MKPFVVVLASAVTSVAASNQLFKRTSYPPAPACAPGSFTPYTYVGCYVDSSTPRALPFDTGLDTQSMTIEICTATCKANGYQYAGLEYYGQCFCGASVLPSAAAPESMCNDTCTGDATQTCGGFDFLSVYKDPTFAPTDSTSIADYEAQGCYTEPSGGRALVYRQDQVDGASLTTESCLAACKQGGYPYAGTEFSSECYCGVELTFGAALAPDAGSCNMPCNGNPQEVCGGSGVLNVYLAKDLLEAQPCSTSSTSTVASSTSVLSTTSSSTSTTTTTSSSITVTTSTTAATTPPSTTATSTSSTAVSTTTTTTSTTAATTKSSSTTSCTTTSSITKPAPSSTTKSSSSTTSTKPISLSSTVTTKPTSSSTFKTSTTTKTTASVTPTPTPCGVGSSCTNSCCSTCTASTSYFCPKAANPFMLSCQSGKCVLPPPCAKRVCVTTKFNDQSVSAGSSIWLSAYFTPKFSVSGSSAGVSVTNTKVTIGSSTNSAPDSYVELISGAPSSGSVAFVNGQWQATVPLGSQNSFLSAVSVTVPAGLDCKSASVTWCGDITAPGQIDAAVAAAVYSSCSHPGAQPQSCDSSKYKAGAPIGCVSKLKPGGTGMGNGDCSGSFTSPYPICKSSGCSKPTDNSGTSGYAGNGQGQNW